MLLAAAVYSNNILVSTPRIETIDPIGPQERVIRLECCRPLPFKFGK